MGQTTELLKRLFLEEWKALLLANLLFTAFSLPLLTVGPALLAMNGVLTRRADDRGHSSCWVDFWYVFKAKFWRGIQLEAVVGLYLLIILWSASVAGQLDGAGRTMLWLFISLSLFLAAMTGVYLVPLLADSSIPFFSALWDAALLSFARLPRTLLAMGAVYGSLCVFLLLYPISVLPWAMLLLAAAAALSVALVWPAINELIFPQE